MNQQAQTPLSNLGKQKGTGRPTSGVDPSLSEIDPDPNTTEMAIGCRLLGWFLSGTGGPGHARVGAGAAWRCGFAHGWALVRPHTLKHHGGHPGVLVGRTHRKAGHLHSHGRGHAHRLTTHGHTGSAPTHTLTHARSTHTGSTPTHTLSHTWSAHTGTTSSHTLGHALATHTRGALPHPLPTLHSARGWSTPATALHTSHARAARSTPATATAASTTWTLCPEFRLRCDQCHNDPTPQRPFSRHGSFLPTGPKDVKSLTDTTPPETPQVEKNKPSSWISERDFQDEKRNGNSLGRFALRKVKFLKPSRVWAFRLASNR